MFRNLIPIVLLCTAANVLLPANCLAYVEYVTIPLSGYRLYSAGRGSVSFSQSYGADGVQDPGTLTIQVNNVPLPPGTELDVLVHEKQVGTLKLDQERNGRLVLKTGPKWSVPRLAPGSLVSLKLPAGSTVLW